MATSDPKSLLEVKNTTDPPSFNQPHSELVTVQIGEDKIPFLLHKAFLVHYSPYFRKSLTGNFQEASTGIVHLKHTTPEAFGLCVEWIMTQQIKEIQITEEQRSLEFRLKADIERPTFEHKTELWILADYLDMPDLQNKCIDMMFGQVFRLPCAPGVTVISRAYESSLPNSMLRKLFIDVWAWAENGISCMDWLQKNAEGLPKDAIVDLAIAQAKRIESYVTQSPLENHENYHVIKKGQEVIVDLIEEGGGS